MPLIGNNWGTCNPEQPKNRRRRVSVLVQHEGANIVLDTSPDFRVQMLDADVGKLDAILYTHDHADHTQGIDDVRFMRSYDNSQRIPAYGSEETLRTLTERFAYIFTQHRRLGASLQALPGSEDRLGTVRALWPHRDAVRAGPRVRIEDPRLSGRPDGLFDRCGQSAEEAFEILQGLDLWIVDCLRFEPHMTHAHFDKAIGWIERVKPKHAILTHLNHHADYDAVKAKCPPGVEPAMMA